jgi:ketosteroid isomerase-like protein
MDVVEGRVEAVRTYYESIDAGAYDALRPLLAPGFVHDRPDRTFEGRDRFVSFMRDERPDPDTTHDLVGIYVDATASRPRDGRAVEAGASTVARPGGRRGEAGGDGAGAGAGDVLARGTLVRADGTAWFRFVDAFEFGSGGDDSGDEDADATADAGSVIHRLATFVRESDATE